MIDRITTSLNGAFFNKFLGAECLEPVAEVKYAQSAGSILAHILRFTLDLRLRSDHLDLVHE
jgi:hypothetical protein